jgi:hypothetical protein
MKRQQQQVASKPKRKRDGVWEKIKGVTGLYRYRSSCTFLPTSGGPEDCTPRAYEPKTLPQPNGDCVRSSQNSHSYSQDKRSQAQQNRLWFSHSFIEKFPQKNGERDENERQNQWLHHSQRRVGCVSFGGLYRA